MKLTCRPHLTFALVLALLALAPPSLAGELFPYQPPSSSGSGQKYAPARPSTSNVSAPGSRASDLKQQFPESVRSLSGPERQELRSYLEDRLREANRQGDARQADYYRELLRRGGFER